MLNEPTTKAFEALPQLYAHATHLLLGKFFHVLLILLNGLEIILTVRSDATTSSCNLHETLLLQIHFKVAPNTFWSQPSFGGEVGQATFFAVGEDVEYLQLDTTQALWQDA